MLIAKIKYKNHFLSKLSEENTLSTNGNFMVSIQLDIIKFLLIYRYLQNTCWFKRGNSMYFHSCFLFVPYVFYLRFCYSEYRCLAVVHSFVGNSGFRFLAYEYANFCAAFSCNDGRTQTLCFLF